ncbi:undecaprenyl-diphosphatase [Cohnella sp. AR92]|uniref:undecaprenyl-diphosphatase n=1 Tax=Cohnella sp. AR92 TaxID=648716 RepID=UPI000F8C52DA|nr:undecaprenyl-diphosphatase [Cohnella sp. AR92]RUS46906.1 undecaprenyl-diphosphatase [Cohnella sp. AR92]
MNFTLFHFLNQFAGRSDTVDDFMEFMAQDIVWILLAVMAALWIGARARQQRLVFYAGLSAAISLFLGKYVVSPVVDHPRPFVSHAVTQLIPHSADSSFPSDHATLAFAIAFSVWYANRRLGSVLLAMACLTGIARVYVGVHYPADIVGGLALSGIVSYLVYRTNGKLDFIPDGIIRFYRRATSKIKFLSPKA